MQMLFIGYTALWIVLFGYGVYLYRQHKALQKEVAHLKGVVQRSAQS
jgi:CcmD family protein